MRPLRPGSLDRVHLLAVHLVDVHHLSLLGLPVESDAAPFVRRRTTRPEGHQTDEDGGGERDQYGRDDLAQMLGDGCGRAMAVRVAVLMALWFVVD